MIAVPEFTPAIKPELLIVAMLVLLLDHTPPVVASLKGVEDPMHTEEAPDIIAGAEGAELT